MMTETAGAKRISPSVARGLPLRRKLDEGLRLFKLHRREARAGAKFDGLFEEIEEYDSLLQQLAGVTLAEAVVVRDWVRRSSASSDRAAEHGH
jgi:hypothetical protein